MKLWNKNATLDKRIEAYTVGIDYILDLKLVPYDCIASAAHAKTLHKAGILTKAELSKLTTELQAVRILSEAGKFKITQSQEDGHTAIENYLTKKLGDLGKKIHTGRSRNDQVLAALRLYYKAELERLTESADDLIRNLTAFRKTYGRIKFPGHTHTRKAMVATIAMWSDAFTESMRDNLKILKLARQLIDQSPLGTGAGYGVPLDLDRKLTAKDADFARVQKSPIYVQNSRGKFEAFLCHACTQIMMDLNRLASDLILFSMPTFGYFTLPDDLCTGSSIMPQKKNPDVLELMRAKAHGVIAREAELKGMVSNLISGYHRDLQLTKKPVMEALDITLNSLSIAAYLMERLEVSKENCAAGLTEEVYATERAYEMVKQGMPFRDAYLKISKEYK